MTGDRIASSSSSTSSKEHAMVSLALSVFIRCSNPGQTPDNASKRSADAQIAAFSISHGTAIATRDTPPVQSARLVVINHGNSHGHWSDFTAFPGVMPLWWRSRTMGSWAPVGAATCMSGNR
jgi:hypothetical protein